MADSAAIQEANKIRVALGLPALPVPGAAPAGPVFKQKKDESEEEDQGSTLESRQAEGFENWKKLEREANEKATREAKNAQIKKARDAAKRFSKLEGKGLGDEPDAPELDTRAWLKGHKKRQKKADKAWKLEQELAEREQQAEYTSSDLAGVKVAHELDQFEDGAEQVLTLKDTTIDQNEEEGDELENLQIKEQDALIERLDLKKKKHVYDPNNTDDAPKTILAQYDEEIDGKKRKRFTLDGQGRTEEDKAALRSTISEKMKAEPISLDFLKDALPASDYIDASEVKIKKKKKSKSARKKAVDDENDIFPAGQPASNGDAMQTDEAPQSSTQAARKQAEPTSLVDDEDLQEALASQRRQALKKRKRIRPGDIAQQLRDELAGTADVMQEDTKEEEGGLVIDETSEFISNLQRPSSPEPRKRVKRSTSPSAITAMQQDSPPSDTEMAQQSYNEIDDDDNDQDRTTIKPGDNEASATGLGDEATLTSGIGATLSMLTQRGIITASNAGDKNASWRDRQKFLAEKQKREAAAEQKARQQRERDRASGKFDRMSAREREEHARWVNANRDQQESRMMAEVFNREYKPDVELKYVDEYGRSMGQKEAFKHLSHQFHGKGSGKGKTEKKLKKIEEEKRKEAQSALDSSNKEGYDRAMGATAKKNRQAGVRLA